MAGRFDGRVAVVTGGASGFGRATVERFVAEGASAVLVDVSDDGAGDAGAIDPSGERVAFHQADVSKEDEVEAAFALAVERFGRCDIAVNNAGIIGGSWIHEPDATEQYQRVVDINVTGVWHGCRAALAVMRPQRSGVILNTGSTAALIPNPASPAYGLAKAAVVHLTRSLAVAYGPEGIRVNAVLPGPGRTGIFERGGVDLTGLEERYIANIPLGRMAEPADIAAAFAYLASDDASFITGSALQVDGAFQPRFIRLE